MKDWSYKNASNVLDRVEELLSEIELGNKKRFRIDDVYDELSIFDWWNDYLSKSQLHDMERFLLEAIKLGYTGYVCFKVGASGCANGMWAYTKESTDGCSPNNCRALYKSFTPEYTYWSFCDDENNWYPKSDENHNGYDSLKTIKQLEDAIVEAKRQGIF